MPIPVASSFLGPSAETAAGHQRIGLIRLPGGVVPVASALAGGTLGTAYSETIGAQGGSSPYSFSVSSGSLPTGTSLNSSTGVISGTPSAPGSFSFTIGVTDANGITGAQAFTIGVSVPVSGNYGWVA
jgi:large repetitive protein